MASNRNKGLDLFRLAAMFCIVLLHVMGPLMNMSADRNGEIAMIVLQKAMLALGKSMVNVFFLISGAFLLGSRKAADRGRLYRSLWKKLALPTLAWLVIYTVMNPLLYAALGSSETLPALYRQQLSRTFGAGAEAHLWFMFVLMGLYLLAPFLYTIREQAGEKVYRWAAIVLAVWGSVSMMTHGVAVVWGLDHILAYTGLFMLGPVILEPIGEVRSNGKAAVRLAAGLLVCLLQVGLTWFTLTKARDSAVLNALATQESYSLFFQAAGILLFSGFAMLNVRRDFGYAASLTFPVFLAHPLVIGWALILPVEKPLGLFRSAGPGAAVLILLGYAAAVYAVCLLGVHVTKKLFRKRRNEP